MWSGTSVFWSVTRRTYAVRVQTRKLKSMLVSYMPLALAGLTKNTAAGHPELESVVGTSHSISS